MKIVSRYDSTKVLYDAPTAPDIKAAVVGAVASRANLAGAYLADANLADAYLARANLADANLADAYLADAYLAGAYLARANLAGANLAGAYLAGAYLADAYLARANLADANLADAYLARANLADANLADAYLADAYLARANLARARGLAPERHTALLMLLEQPGAIRAYKLVTAAGKSPIHSKTLTYAIGQRLSVKNANTNVCEPCGAGINVATLPWCLHNWKPGFRVLVVEFTAADIAAIPTGTDGKFRLFRCTVVGEKVIDPVALGLVKAPEKEADDA